MLFPSASFGTDTNVFRFTCELNEDIDADILQSALDETIKSFDLFRCVLKRGLFWYYLENINIKPVVKEEYKKLCDALYDNKIRSLLFEVTYYGNRINLEIFHVLSDGTGSMYFLSMLISRYISIKHGIETPSLEYDASFNQKEEDSFYKYYTGRKKLKYPHPPIACALRGSRYPDRRLRVITGVVSAKEVLNASRAKNSTLTAYLSACLMNSIAEEIPLKHRKKPVALCIPVNLRNYFPSQSARNFFSTVTIDYDYLNDSSDFDSVLNKVILDFKEKLTLDYLTETFNANISVAYNPFAKISPLFFKDIVLKIAYRFTKKRNTATLSNVGIVRLPNELSDYVNTVSVCSSTNSLQVCMCSYNDKLAISFTTPFMSSDIERRFFRMLTSNGMKVDIISNTEGFDA